MRYPKSNLSPTNEDGIALVASLLFLLVLGVIASSLVLTVQGEMNSSTSYKYSQEAFYVANAGVQKSLMWFNNSYTPHLPAGDYDNTTYPVKYAGTTVLLAGQTGSASVYPDATVKTDFSTAFAVKSLQASASNSGVYSVNATMLKYQSASFLNPNTFLPYTSAIERWRVDSVGQWGTAAKPMGTAQVTGIIENSGNTMFDRSLWGIDSVNLGGTLLLDSYDPALGPYGGTNVGDMGSIGSNGSVSTNGSVTINGDLAYGPTGSFTQVGGSATISGDVIHLPEPRYFPPIPPFSTGSSDCIVGGTNTATCNPGSYASVAANAQSTLILNPGVYYMDSLTMGAQAQIRVIGPTTIFIKSDFKLAGDGIVNVTQDPLNLNIFYSGTNPATVTGGFGFYGEVYAPNAAVTLKGTTDFFGSFIGKSISNSGTPAIHFDDGSLNKNLIQRPFRLITWSQTVF